MDYFSIQFEVTNYQDGEARAANNVASMVLRSKYPPNSSSLLLRIQVNGNSHLYI